jgi:hypothetical protein
MGLLGAGMHWELAIDVIRPHVVRIETPNGHGTGFLAFYNSEGTWCGIATAAHVVGHADSWQQPIKIVTDTGTRFLSNTERVIFLDHATDSAIVLFLKGDLELPQIPIALIPVGQRVSIGAELGWVGYPTMAADTLCFFAGTVSARVVDKKFYLIDGVAINGVSGGPVFHFSASGVQVIGCMVAYHPNLATGAALPGLSRAQDVSHFHGVSEHVRSLDEARARKIEFEEQQARPQAGTAPSIITGPQPDGS